jgi:hypothetical protein
MSYLSKKYSVTIYIHYKAFDCRFFDSHQDAINYAKVSTHNLGRQGAPLSSLDVRALVMGLSATVTGLWQPLNLFRWDYQEKSIQELELDFDEKGSLDLNLLDATISRKV